MARGDRKRDRKKKKPESDEEYQETGLTLERAAKRYLQMQDIETSVQLIEKAIEEVDREIDQAKARRSELSSEKAELLRQARAAARDEGDLPLLDLMEKFGDTEVPLLTLMQELKGGEQPHV